MADDTPEQPAPQTKPARRRAPRRAPDKQDTAASTSAGPAAETDKPAPTRRTRKPAAPRAPAAAPAAPPPPAPKPRSSKRATPRPARRVKENAPSTLAKAGDTVRDNWSKAAVAGGLAAVGALATAALLSLRGSSSVVGRPAMNPSTPDGADEQG